MYVQNEFMFNFQTFWFNYFFFNGRDDTIESDAPIVFGGNNSDDDDDAVGLLVFDVGVGVTVAGILAVPDASNSGGSELANVAGRVLSIVVLVDAKNAAVHWLRDLSPFALIARFHLKKYSIF